MAKACIAVVATFLIVSALAALAQHPEHQRLGTVHFETSCSPRAAPQFDHAVALLHSFEFGASIQAFNDVLATDSTCAMAYWGIALSRWTNPVAPGDRPVALLQSGRAGGGHRDAIVQSRIRARARIHRRRWTVVRRLRAQGSAHARGCVRARDGRSRDAGAGGYRGDHIPRTIAHRVGLAIGQDVRKAIAGGSDSRGALDEDAESSGSRALHHSQLRLSSAREQERAPPRFATRASRPTPRMPFTCPRTPSPGSACGRNRCAPTLARERSPCALAR